MGKILILDGPVVANVAVGDADFLAHIQAQGITAELWAGSDATCPGRGWSRPDGQTWVAPIELPDEPNSMPALTLDQFKAQAQAAVNYQAGACRGRYMTVIPGQEATYLLKEQEAKAAKAVLDAGGSLNQADYAILAAEAHGSGSTLADVLALVLATAGQFRQLAAFVEGKRRGAIVHIERATDAAAVQAILDNLTWM